MSAYNMVAATATTTPWLRVEEDAPREDGDRIEEGETGSRAHSPADVDQARDDEEVQQDLNVDLYLQAREEPQGDHVDDGERVGGDDEEVQGVDEEERLRDRLHVDGDQQ